MPSPLLKRRRDYLIPVIKIKKRHDDRQSPKEQKEALKKVLKQYQHQNINVTLRKMTEYMDISDIRKKVKQIN